ncbi:MAG: hypothetical protein QOG57_6802, partial [Pseudonocardiales bacterium]|nr:hypothetical protein [Pseudonocardiales bacterium]
LIRPVSDDWAGSGEAPIDGLPLPPERLSPDAAPLEPR